MKINFVSFPLEKNLKAQAELIEKYGNYSPEEADFIVALGGDGFILKSLHDFLKINKPIFGMNFGSVGFLPVVSPVGVAPVFFLVFWRGYLVVSLRNRCWIYLLQLVGIYPRTSSRMRNVLLWCRAESHS